MGATFRIFVRTLAGGTDPEGGSGKRAVPQPFYKNPEKHWGHMGKHMGHTVAFTTWP